MTKKNLILGTILIVLIALAYLYQAPFQDWKIKSSSPKNFLAGVEANIISKIEIKQNVNDTILEKEGDKWKISGTKDFYASDSMAANLNKSLNDLKESKLELISAVKEKKQEFLTDEASGLNIKLFAGGNLIKDFIIGSIGSDYQSVYISRPDIDETYSLNLNLLSTFSQPEWRDKTIFSSTKDKINKLRFQYPGREFNIEKINGEWEGNLPYKFSVDEVKIDKIVSLISSLSAEDIPAQDFANTGLEKNLIIVEASGEGIDNTLMIGNDNGEELYYAKKADSDNIYLITKEQRDELNKKIQDLR